MYINLSSIVLSLTIPEITDTKAQLFSEQNCFSFDKLSVSNDLQEGLGWY